MREQDNDNRVSGVLSPYACEGCMQEQDNDKNFVIKKYDQDGTWEGGSGVRDRGWSQMESELDGVTARWRPC